MLTTFRESLQRICRTLLTEHLSPRKAAAAVFWGIFIGIVPLYGLQTLLAFGIAFLLRLNKPLTYAATFINNPLCQPFLVFGSIEIGYFIRGGHFRHLSFASLSLAQLKQDAVAWIVGSVVLGILVGAVSAALAAVAVTVMRRRETELGNRVRDVNRIFAKVAPFDRGFVRWKLRLDRVFELLLEEDTGSGTVVDLGCGYGIGLAFLSQAEGERRLVGCDLNSHRIAVANEALSFAKAEVCVANVCDFRFPSARLILILDVLQYLTWEEQVRLLQRCCETLEPGGRFVFRVHDLKVGLYSTLTVALDRLIFLLDHVGARPLHPPVEDYVRVLENCGMNVRVRRLRNRLPLAHALLIAEHKKVTA